MEKLQKRVKHFQSLNVTKVRGGIIMKKGTRYKHNLCKPDADHKTNLSFIKNKSRLELFIFRPERKDKLFKIHLCDTYLQT